MECASLDEVIGGLPCRVRRERSLIRWAQSGVKRPGRTSGPKHRPALRIPTTRAASPDPLQTRPCLPEVPLPSASRTCLAHFAAPRASFAPTSPKYLAERQPTTTMAFPQMNAFRITMMLGLLLGEFIKTRKCSIKGSETSRRGVVRGSKSGANKRPRVSATRRRTVHLFGLLPRLFPPRC